MMKQATVTKAKQKAIGSVRATAADCLAPRRGSTTRNQAPSWGLVAKSVYAVEILLRYSVWELRHDETLAGLQQHGTRAITVSSIAQSTFAVCVAYQRYFQLSIQKPELSDRRWRMYMTHSYLADLPSQSLFHRRRLTRGSDQGILFAWRVGGNRAATGRW